jgi:hypothetical protein
MTRTSRRLQTTPPIDPVESAIASGDVEGAEQHYTREAIAAKFAEVEMMPAAFTPAAISVNSQGWKYFVGLTPGQCVAVDGANYQGIPVVVDRAQVEPVKFTASPDP